MTILKVLRKMVYIYLIIISQFSNLQAQNNEKFEIDIINGEIKLNFDKTIFKVDTMNTIEGDIYKISFPNSSSYIKIINPISFSTFKCCTESQYILSADTAINGMVEKRGWIDGKALYWRDVQFGFFEFLYNNVEEKNLSFMNKIFDNLIKKIFDNRKCNGKFVVKTKKGKITLDFSKMNFLVDTMQEIDGYIYYIESPNDSSYIRISRIANSTFMCCDDSQYVLNSDTVMGELTDRRGMIDGTELYWREVSFDEVDVVYNYVGGKKLSLMDEIFDDYIKRIFENKQ